MIDSLRIQRNYRKLSILRSILFLGLASSGVVCDSRSAFCQITEGISRSIPLSKPPTERLNRRRAEEPNSLRLPPTPSRSKSLPQPQPQPQPQPPARLLPPVPIRSEPQTANLDPDHRTPGPFHKPGYQLAPIVQVKQIAGLPLYLVKTQETVNSPSDEADELLASSPQVPAERKPIRQPVAPSGSKPQESLSPYDDVFGATPPPIRQPSKRPSPSNNDGELTYELETQEKHRESSGQVELIKPEIQMEDELLLSPNQPDSVLMPSELPSPSDRLRTSPFGDGEAEEDSKRERRAITPYKPPSLESESETVVPLPVIPAPDDFTGFGPIDPDADSLPEPRRKFDIPKPKSAPSNPKSPMNLGGEQPKVDGQSNVDGQPKVDGQSNVDGTMAPQAGVPSLLGPVRPWHLADMYSEQGVQPLMGPPVQGSYRPAIVPLQANRLIEARPTIAPLTTLPERLHSRHWEFKIKHALPGEDCPVPVMSSNACMVEYQAMDFAPHFQRNEALNPCREIQTYYGKSWVDTQRPWVEWWRPFYTGGMYEPGIPVFSDVNLLTPSFLVYGDYRTGVGIHRASGQPIRQWAHRLNLDMDLRFTGTERFHLFTGPLDHNGRFTRLDFSDSDNVRFEEELDFRPDTAFFEGDLGAITGSMIGDDAPFDLPFTVGVIPLLYQNGIWMEDAIIGFAVGSPWRHSRPLNWANYEATFFAGFSDVTTPAFQGNNDASVFGTAWFVEAYDGYIELDYAFLDDNDDLGRSYHNAAVGFTRRYFGRVSNSVRLIGNAGQGGSRLNRTADGGLLLIENSLISALPSTFVPYFNVFVGNGRPQSVARAGASGGILRNTGINFETDGLTAYPTLNATGANSYGGAIGVNVLSADFRQQLICEFSALDRYGNPALSGIVGPQYALGGRYQRALNNRYLLRFDLINGWFDNTQNIYGLRSEFRWKF